jgi:vacuolar protein sorting-associated protein 29
MLLLTLGDLYIPERSIDLPSKFKKLLQPTGKIDKVLCLGNVTSSPTILKFLSSISKDFQIVKGEFDADPLLPQSLVFNIDQLKIGIINGFQIIPKNDPLSLLNHARMMDVDILIYGSTHNVEAYTLDGRFFINPGTATGAFTTDSNTNDNIPCPSFALLEISGIQCILYIYTLVNDEVKIDRLQYSKD